MLQDDGRVGDEGPKVVGLETRVALQVLEKRGLVCVVVGVCTAGMLVTALQQAVAEMDGCDATNVHDCFTHISFFHVRLRRRLLLRSPLSRRRRIAESVAPSAPPSYRRGGDTHASLGERWERWCSAWLASVGKGISSSVGDGMIAGQRSMNWISDSYVRSRMEGNCVVDRMSLRVCSPRPGGQTGARTAWLRRGRARS